MWQSLAPQQSCLRRESEWEELEVLESQRAEKHKASSQPERRKKINCRDELAQSNEELAQSKEELAKSQEELAESQEELAESNAEMKDEKKACLALRLELAAQMMKLHISETSAAVGVSGSCYAVILKPQVTVERHLLSVQDQ